MGFVWFLGCFVASVGVKVPPWSYWLSHIVLIIFPGSTPADPMSLAFSKSLELNCILCSHLRRQPSWWRLGRERWRL